MASDDADDPEAGADPRVECKGAPYGASKRKTVVMPLHKALIDPDGVSPAIHHEIHELAYIRSVAFSILAMYANAIAQSPHPEEHIDERYRRAGEVFNQTLIEQAIQLAHAGDDGNSSNLLFASSCGFLPKEERTGPDVMSSALRKDMRVNMATAFKNVLEYSTRSHQRSALRQIYDLTKQEAKAVHLNICTSHEARLDSAKKAHAKRDNRICLRLAAELDAERRRGGPDVAAIEARLSIAEADRARNARRAQADPSVALASLAAEHPLRDQKRDFFGPFITLEEIVRRELLVIPDTQSQLDQLRYRFSLLQRAERVSGARLFNLTPIPTFGRAFVKYTKLSLSKLCGRTECANFQEAAALVFKASVLRAITSKTWHLGDSIQTDGICVHFSLVTEAVKEGNAKKNEAKKATNKRKADTLDPNMLSEMANLRKVKQRSAFKRLDDEEPEKVNVLARLAKLMAKKASDLKKAGSDIAAEKKMASKSAAAKKTPFVSKIKARAPRPTFAFPPDSTFVGIDPGIVNAFGCAREDELDQKGPAFTVTMREYRHKVGATRRSRKQDVRKRDKLQTDAVFRDAHRAVDDATTKTADRTTLYEGLQARTSTFRTMYEFYGSDRATADRLLNYIGEQRELRALTKVIAPLPTDVVVVGDADFGSTLRGRAPGLGEKLIKALKKHLGPDRVVFGDEFRSSCLDSETQTRMFHPPKELAVSRSGKRYIKWVYGIYQSTSPGYTCTWDRDCNAARNIVKNFRHLYEQGEMPVAFRRDADVAPERACLYRYRWMKDKKKFFRWIDAA